MYDLLVDRRHEIVKAIETKLFAGLLRNNANMLTKVVLEISRMQGCSHILKNFNIVSLIFTLLG